MEPNGQNGTPDEFHLAFDRGKNFIQEISQADPVTAKALLADWRETIIEQLLKAIEVADLDQLAMLDNNSGLILSIHSTKAKIALLRQTRSKVR